jgi:DNA-directed RNA polymerase specialized sigma24 family protein
MSIDAAIGEYSQIRIEPRDRAANPEVAYLNLERITRLKRGMHRLSAPDRLLVEMQYRGKSLREIAALSGLSVAAIKARLFRGKKLLREHL